MYGPGNCTSLAGVCMPALCVCIVYICTVGICDGTGPGECTSIVGLHKCIARSYTVYACADGVRVLASVLSCARMGRRRARAGSTKVRYKRMCPGISA
eukprot:12956076-Ditylum_brightwellii.AAC.1